MTYRRSLQNPLFRSRFARTSANGIAAGLAGRMRLTSDQSRCRSR